MAVAAATDAARRYMRQRSAPGARHIGANGKSAATGVADRKSPVSPRRRPSQPDQALLERLEHRLAAGVDLELAIDVLDVARHGLPRQAQMAGDLGVAESLGDTPQDIDFARRQFYRIERRPGRRF